jgi:predicted Zn-dependent peptidase
VLLHPSFPEKELERLRRQKLAALLRRADSPTAIAGVVFPRLLYGQMHPYGRIDTAKTVEGLSRADVVAFYEKLFVPTTPR